MKSLYWLLFLLIGVCCFFPCYGQGARPTTVNSILATVDGEAITIADVERECGAEERMMRSQLSPERFLQESASLRRAVLNQLIFRKLLYKEYLKQPFNIPSDMLDMEVGNLLKRSFGDVPKKDLELLLERQGTTMSKLRDEAAINIAVNVMIQRYFKAHVNVTPKDVYEHYEKNINKYEEPRKLSFQLLQLNKENTHNLEKVEDLLPVIQKQLVGADGAKFGELVEKYTDGVNRGDYGIVEWQFSQMRPEFQKALCNCKNGDITGPITTAEAYFFLRVVDIKPAKQIPFEVVSEDIEKELKKIRWAECRKQYEAELRSKSMVQIFVEE